MKFTVGRAILGPPWTRRRGGPCPLHRRLLGALCIGHDDVGHRGAHRWGLGRLGGLACLGDLASQCGLLLGLRIGSLFLCRVFATACTSVGPGAMAPSHRPETIISESFSPLVGNRQLPAPGSGIFNLSHTGNFNVFNLKLVFTGLICTLEDNFLNALFYRLWVSVPDKEADRSSFCSFHIHHPSAKLGCRSGSSFELALLLKGLCTSLHLRASGSGPPATSHLPASLNSSYLLNLLGPLKQLSSHWSTVDMETRNAWLCKSPSLSSRSSLRSSYYNAERQGNS